MADMMVGSATSAKATVQMPRPQLLAAVLLACLVTHSRAADAAAVCADSHGGCGSWADGGECEKNPEFMKSSCAESCGFCTPPPMIEVSEDPLLGKERVILTVQYGDNRFGEIVLGFYASVAPVTVAHILNLVRMGGYNTNEIFRIDKGFVCQVQGVDGGRRAPMSKALRAVAKQNVRQSTRALRTRPFRTAIVRGWERESEGEKSGDLAGTR